MRTREEKKRAAAAAAVELVEAGSILGVGTGSTANLFIEQLADAKCPIAAAVASSRVTAERLRLRGIRLVELADAGALPLYVDGADEATRQRWLIKGGGGALTREKILAAASRRFICIVDDSKLVSRLGAFPLALEVIPLAWRQVVREVEALGGKAELRAGFVTDNGNSVLDVRELSLDDPLEWEATLNQIAGVVSNGLFCRRPADLLLVGTEDGVERV